MNSTHDDRYQGLIQELIGVRKELSVRQVDLATKLEVEQSYISKVETGERRLDLIELIDWLNALEYPLQKFLVRNSLLFNPDESESTLPALPIPGKARNVKGGFVIPMSWQGKTIDITLMGETAEKYLEVEKQISKIYEGLNKNKPTQKNREGICDALELAISMLPKINPSDIYHHIVYRLYLRDFKKKQADRSWVRAGGEALEKFLETHYNKYLQPHGIRVKWLVEGGAKTKALADLGIHGLVTNAKLDIALYGLCSDESEVIFGGIHIKASLAERVSDDVPCSKIMIEHGFYSYLFTFDAKSFPPPKGDLVNRGELGSIDSPSDKRKYVEDHGSFSACFSYNLRTIPSGGATNSGKKIYTSSFDPETDSLIQQVVKDWIEFKERKGLS